ncbi:hypothetical protein NMG60_11000432 [Bertholletia excelsa]
MATNLPSCNHADEDYIDMEVSSSGTDFFCLSSISSPASQNREFEFQMSSTPNQKGPTPSPADELFYKGKLLPLHLPPRRQMLQKLLQSSQNTKESFQDENFTIPFMPISTPLESCNISPSESCRVSSELNPDEYFYEWSSVLTQSNGFVNADINPKEPRPKKLKLIKQNLLLQKLKASRAYLKSLFTKSVCSDESSAKADSANDSKEKKNPFEKFGNKTYPTLGSVIIGEERVSSSHRKSFSGAIKRQSATKSLSSSSSSGASSLSSSFSINSSGFYDLKLLKRSSSANSELESSIESAIAHCKQSQKRDKQMSVRERDDCNVCSLQVKIF